MLVIGRVDLRDQGFEAGLVHHEMQMRGPVVVTTGGPHQVSDRPVDRYGVSRGLYASEVKAPGFVGSKAPAQIHLGLLWILILIETFGRRMPDIDFGSRDRTAVDVFDASMNDKPGTRRWGAYQRIAIGAGRLIVPPERPQHVGLGFALAVVTVIEQANQRRHAQ